jgi:hypothetical protein
LLVEDPAPATGVRQQNLPEQRTKRATKPPVERYGEALLGTIENFVGKPPP